MKTRIAFIIISLILAFAALAATIVWVISIIYDRNVFYFCPAETETAMLSITAIGTIAFLVLYIVAIKLLKDK